MEKQCPARSRHQPRHLVPCLPWHGRLAQVGLSREQPEAQPADPPGGHRGNWDRVSVELAEGCTEGPLAQLHTGSWHCSPQGKSPQSSGAPQLPCRRNHSSLRPRGRNYHSKGSRSLFQSSPSPQKAGSWRCRKPQDLGALACCAWMPPQVPGTRSQHPKAHVALLKRPPSPTPSQTLCRCCLRLLPLSYRPYPSQPPHPTRTVS